MKQQVDCLIVGAGFAGLVMAEQLSNRLGWSCIVVDRRDHIGGNSYDYYDDAGVLVHAYGPHYFRSNSNKVVDYLSQFTEWRPVNYKVRSYTKGEYWSFPVNLATFEQLIGKSATEEEFQNWLEGKRVPFDEPANSEEAVLSQVGPELYEQFYKGYTVKQWQKDPSELDASLCNRVPIRTNRDDNYLREKFQAMPAEGYTALFEKLVNACVNTEVHLETDFETAKEKWDYKHLVFTGPIDLYFGYQFGELPYRSLTFENESFSAEQLEERAEISGKQGFWQPEMQVNYPDVDVPFTRIVEVKHATGQQIDATTIVREYPKAYEAGDEPFYPMPSNEAKQQYLQYRALMDSEKDVSFVGRLAKYRYYNMDQVVASALTEADKLCQKYSEGSSER